MNTPSQPKLRLKDKRRRLLWVKVAAGTGVVALSLSFLWYAVRLPEITIAEVEVNGTALAKVDVFTQIAESALQGSYGFFIPKNNALFIPTQQIASAIVAAFPEVESVSVTRDGWQRLVVSVTERTPSALWCARDEDEVLCYLMNKSGFIFDQASGGEPYVQYFGALSGEPVGGTFLAGDFPLLDVFVSAVAKATNRTASSVLVDEHDDVDVTFVEGGTLKFVRTADQKETINNITSVFASRKFNTDEKLEYADFRFGNKVYVKFREE